MAPVQERPTMMVDVSEREVRRHNRWNPSFYDEGFRRIERQLNRMSAVPLGQFIPDELPDGSKGITYGQVGERVLSPRGTVRYLQVINLRDTGIDFAIKPDCIAEDSHNDPQRSRVRKHDVLLSNTAFRGTETLIGRCVVVARDYGKLNISQDIDRIRVTGISPYYVGVFFRTKFGQQQIQRFVHGVDWQKINFGHIRGLLIPIPPEKVQAEVERQYVAMARSHDRAMVIKERLLEDSGIEPGQYGEAINSLAEENAAYNRAVAEAKERLAHLIAGLESVIEGRQKNIAPFAD